MDPASRPFCSERCRMADLGRWLTEGYRVPGDAPLSNDVDPEHPERAPNDETDD
jgi:uncharacterized protein